MISEGIVIMSTAGLIAAITVISVMMIIRGESLISAAMPATGRVSLNIRTG